MRLKYVSGSPFARVDIIEVPKLGRSANVWDEDPISITFRGDIKLYKMVVCLFYYMRDTGIGENKELAKLLLTRRESLFEKIQEVINTQTSIVIDVDDLQISDDGKDIILDDISILDFITFNE